MACFEMAYCEIACCKMACFEMAYCEMAYFEMACYKLTRRLLRRSFRLPKRKWAQGQAGL